MPISRELIYLMTKGKHSFFRKNLNGASFTSDPLSSTNSNNSGSWFGFHTRGSVGLRTSSEPGKVEVVEFKSKHRITKKGKKKNRKSVALSFVTKTINANSRVAKGCNELANRGNKLHQAAKRAAKLSSKKAK